MVVPMEDHRAPDSRSWYNLARDLKKIFKTRNGQTFIFPATGTAGWEVALTNTLSPGDKVLTSRFGQFSHLWADLAKRVGLDVNLVQVPWGEGVPLAEFGKILRADKNHEIKAVLACHNETATGVTSDIAGLRRVMDRAKHPAMLMVDGVSSIASIDFRMDEWKVDVAIPVRKKASCCRPAWRCSRSRASAGTRQGRQVQTLLPGHCGSHCHEQGRILPVHTVRASVARLARFNGSANARRSGECFQTSSPTG